MPTVEPGVVRSSVPVAPCSIAFGVEIARVGRGFGALLLGQPEIENFELLAVAAAIDHEQIGRLDVTVNDAPGVRRGQSARRLLAQGEYLGRGKVVVGEIQLQRLASQQLHDQVGLSVLLAHVVDGADIGVIQGGGRPGLAQEAFMGKVDPGVRRTGGRWDCRCPDRRRESYRRLA